MPELEQASVEPREAVPSEEDEEQGPSVLEDEPETPGEPKPRQEDQPPSRDARDEIPEEDNPFADDPRDREDGEPSEENQGPDGAPKAVEDRDLPPRDLQNRMPV